MNLGAIFIFSLLLAVGCGGKRNIDELPKPEVIPVTQKVSVVSNLLRKNELKVRDSRFMLSISFDQYFSNGKSRRLESFILIDLLNGKVLDSLSRKEVGEATCSSEDSTDSELKSCSIFKLSLNPKAIRITIDCKDKKLCPERPSNTLLTIKKYSDYKMKVSLKEGQVEDVGNIQKYIVSIFPALKDPAERQKNRLLSFLGTAVVNKRQNAVLSYPNRIELQQMVPHLAAGESQGTRHNTGTFPLVRAFGDVKDIFYTSFNKDKSDEAELKLLFKYVSGSATEEKDGYLLMKKVTE